MNGKINFGVDYLHTILETNLRSSKESENAFSLARVLLILEWGLNLNEQDEANSLFWQRIENETLDDFPTAIARLIEHVKDIPDAKSKLLADVILITCLDGDVSDAERGFVQALGEEFDFRPSEIGELAERADDLYSAFAWFANNNSFINKE